jgi:signal transduction histidine kinase
MTGPVGERLRRIGLRLSLRAGTVRWRLTVLGALVMTAMLAAAAVALVSIQQDSLVKGIDEGLRQRVDNLQSAVATQGAATPLLGSDDAEDTFLQLLDAAGRPIGSSPNLSGEAAVVEPPPAGGPEAVGTRAVPAVSASDFRVLARAIPSRKGPFTLVVGKNLDDVAESARVLKESLAVLSPVLVAILAMLVWWVTGRTLRSVEEIRVEVEDMSGNDLGRRVSVPPADDEVSRLARTMNAMLERLERAGRRQGQFASDASHELRGPLTRLRSELELALDEPDSGPARWRNQQLLADTVQLQSLVDDLLFLARSDDRAAVPGGTVVDLDDLVLAEARRLRDEGRVLVDTSAVGPARVRGEPRHLARALRNLTANAARHARSTVFLEARETGSQCLLVVADDGPGIPQEHRAAVFERFVRLDEARSRDDGGSGLGLAIVKEIVTRHAGTVEVTDSGSGGARFTITLPRE